MARYVLLRIDDDAEADDLLRDIAMYPHNPLLTPSQEHTVMVEIVPDVDPGDRRARDTAGHLMDDQALAQSLRGVLRRSYLRASQLAAEAEADA